MKPSRIIFIAVALIMATFIFSWLSITVPGTTTRNKTTAFSGTITKIYSHPGSKDITIRLNNDSGVLYYINRGLENTDTAILMQLINQPVSISWYSGGFDLLGLRHNARHICEVASNGNVVYSEIRD